MLDSDFWQGIADKFRTLDPWGCLRLEWSYFKSLGSYKVDLIETGDSCKSVAAQFRAFATRAGAKYNPGSSSNALLVWLHLLAACGPNDRPQPLVTWTDKDDPNVIHESWGGCIMRVCVASADLCNTLEVQAFERERTQPQAPIPSTSTEAASPKRDVWLRDRLKERGWDKNDVQRMNGPDRKTVQKILDGKFVRETILEKLVFALNRKKINSVTITLMDIPTL